MPFMVDNSKEQAWRNMIPPGMSLSDEDCSEYSFAAVYTGPRPAYVPKAEPFGSFPLSSQVVVNSHQNCSSPSPSRVVVDSQSSIVCTAHEGFVNETRDQVASAASIATEQFSSPSQNEAPSETGDAAHEDLHTLNARRISLDNIFTSCQLEPGEVLPYGEQRDHISTHSEFSGRQSSSSHSSTNSISEELQDQTSPEPSPSNGYQRKKGECFVCTKVNRMQKETCLVCSAKYCGSCVLLAMGSMPEGRKCVQCIGQPICELRRHYLGKPTRLLNRLLSTLEVHQIMKAERECAANQLRPEQLYVNGKQLTSKEFQVLLGCENPPSRLKPGRYWYDAECGYWGKEGQKPEKIITVYLKVGGDLQEEASAGCTKVYINNREITKVELKMLKVAGVLCPPETRLLVHADGSYQEEVQNHCPGKIWNKAAARYFCYWVSLPTPNVHAPAPEPPRSVPAYLERTTTHKILLLGHAGCGTRTICKQAKFLYGEQFTFKELQDIKAVIQRNIYKYIVILLEARERFEDEENAKRRELEENTPSTSAQRESGDTGQELLSLQKNVFIMTARLKDQADWFLQADASGDLEKYYLEVTREHASLIEELWKDPAIQATYKRRAELHMLPDVAGDFLNRVVDISANTYSPSDRDILFAEGGTHGTGIAEMQFCMDEDGAGSGAYNENYNEPLSEVRYHLIRINGSGIADGCKLLKMFDDVQAVIFCVALDSYDQMWSDGRCPVQNKMLVSRNLFESILTHPNFKDKPMVLLLNKYDLFLQKVHTVPLQSCEWFSDFNPVKSTSHTPQAMAEQAYTYIAHMFKKLFEMVNPNGGKLYTFQLQGRERSTVNAAFQYLKEILVWEESKKRPLPLTSLYTSETSSLDLLRR